MGNKHTYSIRLGQDIYDIPESEIKRFIKENPQSEMLNTTPVKLGNDIYDIPDNEKERFLKDNPQATTAVNFKPFKPIETKDFYKTTERESTISGYEQREVEKQNQQRRADDALAKMKINYMQKHNTTEEETEQHFSAIENAKAGYTQSGYESAKKNPYLSAYGAGGLDLISGVLGDFELLGEMVGLKDHSKLSLAEKMQSFGAGVSMDTQDDWNEGNYLKSGFKSMLRSAPMTAMALTGHASGIKGLGFSTMAVPSTGNKFIDLKRNYDLSLAEKASNAILTGLAEGASEELGTFANFDELSKSINRMVSSIGKQQTKAKLILDFTKKLALGGIEEGAEEWANTYAEAIIDQAISGKQMDMENTLKNANMAFVMGGLSGMMMTPAFAGISQTGKIGKTEVIPGIYMSKKAFNENPDKAKEIAIAFKGGKEVLKTDENKALIESMYLDEDALDARDLARKNDENILSNSHSVIEKAMDIEKWFDNGIYQEYPRNAIKAIDEVINSEKEYINEEALEFLQNTKEKIKADVKSDIKNGYGRIDKMNDSETALFNKTTETLKTLRSTLKDSNEAPQELIERTQEIIAEYGSLYQNIPTRLRNIELRTEIENLLFWASFINQKQEGQTQDDSQIIESDIDTTLQEDPQAPKPEDKPLDISSKIQNAINETKPYFEQEKDENTQQKLSLIESALKEFESSEDTPENNQKILDEINGWNLSSMFSGLSENNQNLLAGRIESLFKSVSDRMNRNADNGKTIEDKSIEDNKPEDKIEEPEQPQQEETPTSQEGVLPQSEEDNKSDTDNNDDDKDSEFTSDELLYINRYAVKLSSRTGKPRERFLEMAKKLVRDIKNKDFVALESRLHSGNPESIKLFNEITGNNAKTQKQVKTALSKMEGYDEYDKQRKKDIVDSNKQAVEKALQKKAEEVLNEIVSYHGKRMTNKEFIDTIISEGFTQLITREQGISTVYRLENKKGVEGFTFRKKAEKDYIDSVMADIDSKAEQEQIKSNPESVASDEDIDHLFGKDDTQPQTQPETIEVIDDYTLDDEGNIVENESKPIVKPEVKAKEEPEITNYGSSNKLVSTSRAEEIRRKLRDKLNNQLNSGFDPEIFTLSIELAVYHIEAGVRKFIPFVKKMISDVGNGVRPFLKSSYNGAKNFPNMTKEIVSEMDSYEYVDSFNLDEILLDDSENNSIIETENNKEDQNGKDLSGGTSNSGGAGNRHQSDNRSRGKTNEVGKKSKSGSGSPVSNGSGSNEQSSDNDNGTDGLSGSMDSVEGHKATGISVPSGATQLRGKQVLSGDSDYFTVGINLDLRDKDPVHLTKGQRRKINEQALKILDKPLSEITDEDKEILRQYTGMGGLSENAGELGYLNQHYTDYPVIKAIYTALEKAGFKFKKALEPAVGVGNFIGMSPEADWDAVDIDETNAKIAQILYPQATVYNTPFQKFVKKGYDLIISNVPFLEKLKGEVMALHDLYFVKSINQVKDNGLVVFITSKGTMDKVDDSIRLELINKADLVGAFRLPSGTFEENANTSVITDIIVLQKRPEGAIPTESQKRINDQFVKSVDHPEHGLKINEYYVENPEHILGTLEVGKNKLYGGGESLNVTGEANLDNINFKYQAYEIKPEINETQDNKKIEWEREKYIQALEATGIVYDLSADRPDYKIVNGVFHLYDGTKTAFTDVNEPVHYYHTVTAETQNKLTLLFELQKIANEFQETGLKPDMLEISELIDKYKKIAKSKLPATDKAFKKELKEVPYLYEDLSTLFKEGFELADIFTVKTQHKNSGKITLNEDSSLLDKAKLYQSATGFIRINDDRFTKEEIESLISTGDYCLVDSETIQNKIDYYSGNIRAKIKDAQENIIYSATQKEIDIYERQIEKLNEKMPARKSIEDITIYGNEPWLDDSTREKLQIISTTSRNQKVFALGHKWKSILSEKGVSHVENKINGRNIYHAGEFVDKSGDVDIEGQERRILEAEVAIEKYTKHIKNSIIANQNLKKLVEDLYNAQVNFYAEPDYIELSKELQPFIDELPKTKEGKPFGLRKNQIEWVSRALYEGKGINAHDVGGGKTYAGIFLAHIMKAKGMANKPMFVVPSKVIYKWKRDIEFMYPEAKIIVVNLSGNDKADKIRTLAKIKKENADYILITHEGFKSIEIKQETIDEGYEEIAKDIFSTVDQKARDKSVLGAQLEGFKNKLKKRPNSFGGIYFEDLGVDCIIADEAHAFKNVPVPSKLKDHGTELKFGKGKLNAKELEEKVAKGIPLEDDDTGNIQSFRAIDFKIKSRYIQKMNNDRNIFLLTATPTPNKILEIYSMLNIIGRSLLEEYGIENIYEFSNMFFLGKQEINQSNPGKDKTYIGEIKSFQLFKQITRRFIDLIPTHKMPWIKLPTAEVLRHSIDQSERDKRIQEQLNKRFRNAKGKKYKEGDELKIEVFSQIRSSGVDSILYDNIKNIELLDDNGDFLSSFFMDKNPKTSKIAHCVDLAVQTHKDNKEAGQLIFLDIAGHSSSGLPFGKNLHQYIKKQLIEKGFKATEIGIISGQEITGTDGKEKSLSGEKLNLRKDEIVTEYNDGKWKVLIGSTEAMGEGMDIQKTTTDIYHLDIPFTPREYIQRNGRGIRYGNKNDNVRIHYYVKKGSMDNIMLDIVSGKEQFNTAFNEDTTEDIVTLSDSGNSIMPSEFEIQLSLALDDQERANITLEKSKDSLFRKLLRNEYNEKHAIEYKEYQIKSIEEYRNKLNRLLKSVPENESSIDYYKAEIEKYNVSLNEAKKDKNTQKIEKLEDNIKYCKERLSSLRKESTKIKENIKSAEESLERQTDNLNSQKDLIERIKKEKSLFSQQATDFLSKYTIGYSDKMDIGKGLYTLPIRTDIPYEEVKNLKFKKNSDLQLIHDNTIATIELSDKLKRFQQEFFEQTKRKAEFTEVKEALSIPKFAKANRIAKAFGLDGVIVFDSNIRGLDGAVYDNTIYISKDNMNPVDEILKHELVHHIRIKSESSYQALAVILKDSPSFKRFVSKNKERLLNIGYNESVVDEELLADFIAEKVNNKHFWQMIANKDAGLFDRIKNAVQYYWNLLRRKLKVINDKNMAYRVSMREIFRLESEINKIQNELLRDRKRIERYLAKKETAKFKKNVEPVFSDENNTWHIGDRKIITITDERGAFSGSAGYGNGLREAISHDKLYRNLSLNELYKFVKNDISYDDPRSFSTPMSTQLFRVTHDAILILGERDRVGEYYHSDADAGHNMGYDEFRYKLDKSDTEYIDKIVLSNDIYKMVYDSWDWEITDSKWAKKYKDEDIENRSFYAEIYEIFRDIEKRSDFNKTSNIKFKLSEEVQAKNQSIESIQGKIAKLEEMRDNLYKTHKRQTKALKDKFERQYRSAERETLDMDPEIEELIKGFAKVHDIESWEDFTKYSTPDGRLSTVLSFKEAEEMAKKELEIDGDIREFGQDGYSFAIQAIRLKLKSNAFYKLAINSAKSLKDKDTKISDNDKTKLEKAISFYLEQGDAFNIQYSLAKSNAGRILRYARESKEVGDDEVSKLTAERAKQQVKEFVEKMTGAEEDTGKDGGLHSGSSSNEILDMLSNPDKPVTPEELAIRTPSIYQYILMSFYTGLLSSPATHGRNIINTALNVGGLEPIINMISDLVTHYKTTGFAGLGKGFIEGVHRAGQIITGKDNNQNTGLSKFGSIDEYYQFADSQKIQKGIYKTLTITTKALQAEDAVSYSMAFENSMTHIALELSSNKKYVRTMFGEALSQEEAYKKLIEKPTQDMIKKAVEYALERTYNKAVPDGVMGTIVNLIENIRKRFEGHSPAGKFVGYLSRVILPFTRIVANVTNSMIDYTPVASSFRANMKNKDVRRRTAHESAKYEGKILQAVAFGKDDIAKELLLSKMTMEFLNNREIRLQISKSITGYVLTAILMYLLGDLISGGGAPDKEKNSQLRATGWQEYSIKIGDKWVSYKNIPGINLILSAIGNIHDSIEYKKFKAGELTRRIGYATLGIFNTILDQSFLSGLSDVITMLAFRNDKDLIELLSSSVTTPLPTAWNAMKYIHDIFDPRIKKPEGLAEIFWNENRILGQDSDTPVRINTFGQVAEKQSPKTDILGTIGKFTGVGVGYVSIKDPELELITKSVLQAGMKLPASNGRVSVKFRGENIDLDGQQTEKFLIYRGEKFSKKLKAKRNLILKLSERIQNGEAFQKERLERILKKMHDESSDYAKRRVKRDMI